jgi:hypothetical protein
MCAATRTARRCGCTSSSSELARPPRSVCMLRPTHRHDERLELHSIPSGADRPAASWSPCQPRAPSLASTTDRGGSRPAWLPPVSDVRGRPAQAIAAWHRGHDRKGIMREGIARVLAEYPAARSQPLTGHPLASFITHDLSDEVRGLVGSDSYKVAGSPGKGNWAETPWVAVFDRLVTETAQRGYYIVYLFRRDGQAVWLSLGQGTTEVLEDRGRLEYLGSWRSGPEASWACFRPTTRVASCRVVLSSVQPATSPAAMSPAASSLCDTTLIPFR